MIKKILYSIFICLASFFLMSHNAMAVELATDVEWVRGNHNIQIMPNSWAVEQGYCQGLASGVYSDYINCNGLTKLSDFNITIPSMSYKYGDWIVAEFFINQNLNNVSNHMNFYGLQYAGSNPVDLAYTDISELNANSSKITLYFRAWGNFTDNNLRLTGKNGASALIFNAANGTDSQLQFRCGLASVFRDKNPSNYTGSINDVKNSVNSINDTLKQQQQQQQQQQEQEKQDANNTIDDSKNSSNNSSSDVQNNSSTQSLLSVVTGFFGAITSASPSSCVLTGQINEYLTPSFDLCQLDPPPALTALLSIPVAIALFFFAKHMLNKIIALIRSFQ